MLSLLFRRAALAAALVFAAPALAQEAPPPGPEWAERTRVDVEAAYVLLRDNHPGALPEVGDAEFVRRLEAARATALERAAQVTDVGGHRAVMNGLAVTMGDAHIAFQPAVNVPYRWAGLVMGKTGPDWRVTAHHPLAGEGDLTGARLVGCDGRSAEAVARERLGGFRADWSVEAQQVQYDYLLLLDDSNPFVSTSRACVFAREDGTEVELELPWRDAVLTELRDAINAAPRGRGAGMGVAPFAGGWWISLGTLGDDAAEVVSQVRARADALRAAPAVVLDLRGNGGGNSVFGNEIAEALVGAEFLSGRRGAAGPCATVWRVSPGNAAALRRWRDSYDRRGPQFAAWAEGQIEAMDRALAAGEPLDRPVPTCPEAEPTADTAAVSALQGRLVLITDGDCFSSCLLVVDQFRRLGALHLGHTTNRHTRYMEVRGEDLPSGLGAFTTLQKVAIGDAVVGPFTPEVVYPGLMNDEAALQVWVVEQLALTSPR